MIQPDEEIRHLVIGISNSLVRHLYYEQHRSLVIKLNNWGKANDTLIGARIVSSWGSCSWLYPDYLDEPEANKIMDELSQLTLERLQFKAFFRMAFCVHGNLQPGLSHIPEVLRTGDIAAWATRLTKLTQDMSLNFDEDTYAHLQRKCGDIIRERMAYNLINQGT